MFMSPFFFTAVNIGDAQPPTDVLIMLALSYFRGSSLIILMYYKGTGYCFLRFFYRLLFLSYNKKKLCLGLFPVWIYLSWIFHEVAVISNKLIPNLLIISVYVIL